MAPKIVGLAFVTFDTLQIVLSREFDLKIYPGEGWDAWRKEARNKLPLCVVEDKNQFNKAVEECGVDAIVVLGVYPWLKNRGIYIVDAEEGDKGEIKPKVFDPNTLSNLLKNVDSYKISDMDMWLTKGNCQGMCAGCKDLETCGSLTTDKACEKYEKEVQEKLYRRYGLEHLVHLCFKNVQEDNLLKTPKQIWKATYSYAVGKMPEDSWIEKVGRVLRTAGTPKRRVYDITLWVKRYGRELVAGNCVSPITKIDISLAKKILKTK